MTKKIVVVDDHFLVREGLLRIFSQYPDIEVVGQAGNAAGLFELLSANVPDVVSLDWSMPGLSGAKLVAHVRNAYPCLPILVVSMFADTQVAFGALRAGANGYVTKDSDPSTLARAVYEVAAGGRYVVEHMAEQMVFDSIAPRFNPLDILSPREREILGLIMDGANNVQIGDLLHVSAKTVSTHKTRLMQKLKVSSTSELILLANRHGGGTASQCG
nr:response regulator transcription factor [uncultured Duganella sp.]